MLAIFLNELRLLLRDRWAFFYTLVAPVIVITIIVAARYGAGGAAPRVLIPIIDNDGGPGAATLIEILSEHANPEKMSLEAASYVVREQNRAPAALVIPAGFSDHYKDGESSDFELLTDPAQGNGVQTVKVLLLLAEKELRARQDPLEEEPLAMREENLTGRRLSVESHEQNVPGFTLMFVLLATVGGISMSLHYERDCRTIERLLVAPNGFTWLLFGKLLARWIVGVVQMLILLWWSRWIFGISLGSSVWAAPVLSIVTVLATSALGLLVASVVVTREQTLMVSLALVLVFCALGGLWWPEQIEPGWMQSISPLFYTTWAMRGLTDVVLRDRNLLGILWPVSMLFLNAVIFLFAGLTFFRGRYAAR